MQLYFSPSKDESCDSCHYPFNVGTAVALNVILQELQRKDAGEFYTVFSKEKTASLVWKTRYIGGSDKPDGFICVSVILTLMK
jgi:hypothetical protein